MKIISPVLLFVLFTAVLGQTTPDVTTQSSSLATETTSDKTTPTTLDTTTPLESTTTTSTTDISTTTLSSTTISSTTTELPVPSSSSAPPSTKAPVAKTCPFNVTEGNVTCIRADLQAEFVIDAEGHQYTVLLGCEASTSESDCTSNDTQTLVLTEPTHTLTMVFVKKANKVLVQNVTFSYNLPQGPKGTTSNSSEDLFGVKSGKSYLCKSKFDIHLENVTVEVHEVHIQAFIEEGKDYGDAEECAADEKVSDIVPIAVGVALASLIIVVLIAYLVGRRRSRQKGYQSV